MTHRVQVFNDLSAHLRDAIFGVSVGYSPAAYLEEFLRLRSTYEIVVIPLKNAMKGG